MARPYFDLANGSTNSSRLVSIITFKIKATNPVRITEISLLPDSAFQTYGKFALRISGLGQIPTQPQDLKATLTIDFSKFEFKTKLANGEEVKGFVMLPNETIEILAQSDGTNTISMSAMVVGEEL
jgi:hypothetical protein